MTLFFLQETHSHGLNEIFWRSQWGGHCWFSHFSSNSRGVGILIKQNHKIIINSVDRDPAGRFLILDIINDGFHINLVNIYGPNQDDPDFYFDTFSKLNHLDSSRLVLAGDLNVALGPLDYRGSRASHGNENSRKALMSLIDEFNLFDVWRTEHPKLRAYTRHQKNAPALSRLDYILVSSVLADNFNHSEIVSGIKSDHSIVKRNIAVSDSPKGKIYWKMNCHYLRHDADFVVFLKGKISEFKEVHMIPMLFGIPSNVLSVVIVFSIVVEKRRRSKEISRRFLKKNDQIKHGISNISPCDTQQLSNLLHIGYRLA